MLRRRGLVSIRTRGAPEIAMAIDPALPILVVDDYGTMVRIMRNLLKQIGFEDIDTASGGATALELLQSRKYGLIISDWNMEPMSGLELLQKVRSDPATSAVPFMMITAESKTENVLAARRAGVTTYLEKPFSALKLKGKIDQIGIAA
jgi:two-component system chemotaxis response regulator CheY